MDVRLPTIIDIEAAAGRLAGVTVKTPLLRSTALDRRVGGTVLLKAEVLQHTGSFKFRGAYNRLAQLEPAQRTAGVVAWSSGNHAQGVAAAAQKLGVPATIVMPRDAPAIKIDNTRNLGAKIAFYDRITEDREAIGRAIAAESGAVVVPPFDDPDIIAGQGTVGLEIVAQVRELGVTLDDVIAPASGGGLIAGIGLAVHASSPATNVYTAEPAGYDDHRRSLLTGERVCNASTANALCDALLAPTPGALTWSLNRRSLRGGYAVDDMDVKAAVTFAHRDLNLVVEPSGAIALAVLLSGLHTAKDRTVAVVLSGGNVDPAAFQRLVTDD